MSQPEFRGWPPVLSSFMNGVNEMASNDSDRNKMHNINTLINTLKKELAEYADASARLELHASHEFLDGFIAGMNALGRLFIACSESGNLIYEKDDKKLKQLQIDWNEK